MSIVQWAVCRRSRGGVWLPETGTVRSKCMDAIAAWNQMLGERDMSYFQASVEAGDVKAMRVEVRTMRGEGYAAPPAQPSPTSLPESPRGTEP